MRFQAERPGGGNATNILEDGRVILHLNGGTVRNEENIDRLIQLLNEADQARKGLRWARDLINYAVKALPLKKLSKWEGVRGWLETAWPGEDE